MKNIEIEVRVKVSSSDKLIDWLGHNAKSLSIESQEDTYYHPKDNSYIYIDKNGEEQSDKWLRTRVSETESSICYKLVHRDDKGNFLYADEYETNVENPIIEINPLLFHPGL